MPSCPKHPRILICRLSALGDCVHTLPLACALRRRFPDAFIAWLTQTACAPLLAGHEALGELIAVPRSELGTPRKLLQLRSQLQARRFDLSLDPQSLTKSAVLAWLCGAPRRIGFARPHGRELAPLLNNELVAAADGHAVDRNLQLLRAFDVRPASEARRRPPADEAEFKLPLDATARATIRRFLKSAGIAQPPVVMHPGAGWDSKLWMYSRYAAVARHLGERYGQPTVVAWAGSRAFRWADEIAALSGGYAVVAPETTLPELVALLRAARFYLGSDSGPLHMAAAVGTRCIGMYGPSRPAHNGPYGRGHVTLQAYYQAGSTRQRKRASNDAMRAISSDMVIDACERLLTSHADQPSDARAA